MSKKFDLDDFLDNYKPKDIEDYLKHYINNKKLRGYRLLKNNDAAVLEPNRHYIRYVKITDTKEDEIDVDHKIHGGGFYVTGGYLSKGFFTRTNDSKKISHLQLCYNIVNEDGTIKKNVYVIALSRYHIFYKSVKSDRDNNNKRNQLIELIKNL